MIAIGEIIDGGTKLVGMVCGILTLFLAWKRILPRLDEIHSQTNSLATKAEAGARAMGVQEGLRQAAEIDPAVAAAAAALALSVAADRAAEVLKEAKEESG